MSILIPVYSKGITLNELPEYISVYFEIANCKQRCKGCHSVWLQENAPYLSIKEILSYAKTQIDRGANAIILMGGTTNGIPTDSLKKLINTLAYYAPVCIYSGSDNTKADLDLLKNSKLKWLKTGSYQELKGGLDVDTTNQRFYVKYTEDRIFDMTPIFFKQHEKS